MAFLSGYSKRKKITVDYTQVPSNLTDFSFIVKITNDANIGASAASNGTNCRFTSSDGTTLLNYGIIKFSISGGLANAIFRVKIPTISSSVNTEIYLYYDNPSASDGQNKSGALDGGVISYWPLEEVPTGAAGEFIDWKGNYNGSALNATPSTTVGITGSGIYADYTQGITFGNITQLNGLALVSLGASIKHATGKYVSISRSSTFAQAYGIIGTALYAETGGGGTGYAYLNAAAADDVWGRYYATFNAGTPKIYYNGVDYTGGTIGSIASPALPSSSDAFKFGRTDGNTEGYIDEIILESGVRSADWILYDYRNQFTNSSTFSLGNEEVTYIAAPKVGFMGRNVFGIRR